jgi:hypothetical protein
MTRSRVVHRETVQILNAYALGMSLRCHPYMAAGAVFGHIPRGVHVIYDLTVSW